MSSPKNLLKWNVQWKADLGDLVCWDMGGWVLRVCTNPQKKKKSHISLLSLKSKGKGLFHCRGSVNSNSLWKKGRKYVWRKSSSSDFHQSNVPTTLCALWFLSLLHVWSAHTLATCALQFSWVKATLTFNIPLTWDFSALSRILWGTKMKGKLMSAGKWYSSWPMAVFCSASAPNLKAPAILRCLSAYILHCRAALLKRQGSGTPC